MKNTIIPLFAIAACALISTVAQAETKVVSQGRAGFTIIHTSDDAARYRDNRPETRVALVMDKPEQTRTVKTVGRAGYRVVPAGNRGR